MPKTYFKVDDGQKYLCSRHGPHGHPDCSECCANLARLLVDNDVKIATGIKAVAQAMDNELRHRERMK